MKDVLFEWVEIHTSPALKLTFEGLFTRQAALTATDKWKEAFESQPDKSFIVIFSCLKMTDYEPMARLIWQNNIKLMRKQISAIWVVTDSRLIIAGAGLLSVFTSFTIRTVSSEDKIFRQKVNPSLQALAQ